MRERVMMDREAHRRKRGLGCFMGVRMTMGGSGSAM